MIIIPIIGIKLTVERVLAISAYSNWLFFFKTKASFNTFDHGFHARVTQKPFIIKQITGATSDVLLCEPLSTVSWLPKTVLSWFEMFIFL